VRPAWRALGSMSRRSYGPTRRLGAATQVLLVRTAPESTQPAESRGLCRRRGYTKALPASASLRTADFWTTVGQLRTDRRGFLWAALALLARGRWAAFLSRRHRPCFGYSHRSRVCGPRATPTKPLSATPGLLA